MNETNQTDTSTMEVREPNELRITNKANQQAYYVRNNFKTYFNSNVTSVRFQSNRFQLLSIKYLYIK